MSRNKNRLPFFPGIIADSIQFIKCFGKIDSDVSTFIGSCYLHFLNQLMRIHRIPKYAKEYFYGERQWGDLIIHVEVVNEYISCVFNGITRVSLAPQRHLAEKFSRINEGFASMKEAVTTPSLKIDYLDMEDSFFGRVKT